ncbi:hypothetical protein ADJ70_09215 [Olsenella sp. oral taxon 807]|nr:hypothetical protein ADJ70_09215 [Olsenella sp. oral taxon 807]
MGPVGPARHHGPRHGRRLGARRGVRRQAGPRPGDPRLRRRPPDPRPLRLRLPARGQGGRPAPRRLTRRPKPGLGHSGLGGRRLAPREVGGGQQRPPGRGDLGARHRHQGLAREPRRGQRLPAEG